MCSPNSGLSWSSVCILNVLSRHGLFDYWSVWFPQVSGQCSTNCPLFSLPSCWQLGGGVTPKAGDREFLVVHKRETSRVSPPPQVTGAHLLESLNMKLDNMECSGSNPLVTRHEALAPLGSSLISIFCDLYCNMSFPLFLFVCVSVSLLFFFFRMMQVTFLETFSYQQFPFVWALLLF